MVARLASLIGLYRAVLSSFTKGLGGMQGKINLSVI